MLMLQFGTKRERKTHRQNEKRRLLAVFMAGVSRLIVTDDSLGLVLNARAPQAKKYHERKSIENERGKKKEAFLSSFPVKGGRGMKIPRLF